MKAIEYILLKRSQCGGHLIEAALVIALISLIAVAAGGLVANSSKKLICVSYDAVGDGDGTAAWIEIEPGRSVCFDWTALYSGTNPVVF